MAEKVLKGGLDHAALSELALGAGSDAVGVAITDRAPHADFFLQWLGEGMHVGMEWMARDPEMRCRPALLLTCGESRAKGHP